MAFLKKWFTAARPFSFTAAIVPAVVGSLLSAPDGFSLWKAAFAVLGSVAILAGTNFVNDYYDDKKGADGANLAARPGSIQQGVATPRGVHIAGLVCFAIGGTLGLVLCATTSWTLLWISVAIVRLPTSLSVSMSRRLFACRIAVTRKPMGSDASTGSHDHASV